MNRRFAISAAVTSTLFPGDANTSRIDRQIPAQLMWPLFPWIDNEIFCEFEGSGGMSVQIVRPISTAMRRIRRAAKTLAGRLDSNRRLARPPPATTNAFQTRLERLLFDNILGFWMPRTLDERHGGYIINFDPFGQPTNPATKGVMTQARMLWFFSRLARSEVAEHYDQRTRILAAAESGYRFLHRKMWDAEHGGFYWEVDQSGTSILDSRKHLCGQCFALYALSEYYLLSKRKDVAGLGRQGASQGSGIGDDSPQKLAQLLARKKEGDCVVVALAHLAAVQARHVGGLR